MARLNYSVFKKMIRDEKSKLSDKEVLTGHSMVNYLTSIAENITKMFHRRILVRMFWDDSEAAKAGYSTENHEICVNADNFIARGKKRIEKFRIIIGIFLHEAAHLLYTNFKLLNKWKSSILKEHTLYPLPEHKNAEKIKDFLDKYPKCASVLYQIMFDIFNPVEDGYVDLRIMKEIPGYAKERKEVRREIYSKSVKSVSELRDSGCKDFEILTTLLFSYGKFQKVNATLEELKSDPVCLQIKRIIPLIDKFHNENNSYLRFKYLNEIICAIFAYIQKELEDILKDKPEDEKSGSSSSDSSDSGSSDSSSESSDSGSSDDEDSTEDTSAEGETEPKDADSDESAKTPSPSEEDIEKALSSIASMFPESSMDADDESKFSKRSSVPVDWSESDEKETGISGEAEGTEVSDEDILSKDADDEKSDDASEKALSRIIEEKAEEKAGEKYEKELKGEMSSLDKEISYGATHSSTPCVIDRDLSVPATLVHDYESYRELLGPISKRTQKELLKEIKDRQQGWRLNGLYSGNRISQHDCHRKDGKLFTKKRLPEDIPNLAVTLLVDESGSMLGKRIEAARKTAWIIYDFCTSLHIPVSVIGHSEDFCGKQAVRLTNYANFDSVDSKDKYRIMGICAKENNRDGYALRYCAEALSRRTEDIKLLFVISDGAPAASGYSMRNGKPDIQNVLREYGKKHILFITAGIGNDTERIKDIYTGGLSEKTAAKFLDIEDLDKLPKAFIKIIKKYLE